MRRACAVTGRGAVSALGQSASAFVRAVLSGEAAIAPLEHRPAGLRLTAGAPIRGFVASDHFSERDMSQIDRFTQFAAVAAREAWREAGLAGQIEDPSRIGVFVGTANGGIDALEHNFARILVEKVSPRPLTVPQVMSNAPAVRIAADIGACGPVFGLASACASGAHAILVGATFLRAGLIDIAVVGGTDSCFSEGVLRAWDALRAVSTTTCRPFSAGRDGMVLGEGAGILVLERPERALRRGARIRGLLRGGGMATRASGLLASDAGGMADAMRLALADADLSPEAVGYVNAHGTGTESNDLAEATAIRAVFGSHAVPVSSTKSMIGHALGAAGALEAIATIAALEQGTLPPTLNFLAMDPAIGFDPISGGPRRTAVETALSNSFAFGGANVCLAFSRHVG
ncbi:nodulation protein E [Aquabacter spiritensis]|uniref:Nodulation protein E n=1 Tax=Aquabacter spiritensis TaxID=933073 RepID=A0A4R3LU73_9HYPH|nr:nodulation protein E [Aquabacter spiritensis]